MVAGICRWLVRRGVKVAPFKAQNMSLNSFVTREGAEIGRAQAMQAQAARVEPTRADEPGAAQARRGQPQPGGPHGPAGGRDERPRILRTPEAVRPETRTADAANSCCRPCWSAWSELRAAYDVVICEGAGQPAEINLRRTDIVNMGLARAARLPVRRRRRHRPRRRLRLLLRHHRPAQRRGPGAGRRIPRQQVPRRRDPARARASTCCAAHRPRHLGVLPFASRPGHRRGGRAAGVAARRGARVRGGGRRSARTCCGSRCARCR